MKPWLIAVWICGCGSSDKQPPPAASNTAPAPRDDGMIGAAPATLGSAFAGIAWDKPARRSDARRIGAQLGVEVELEPGPVGLRAIEVKQARGCSELRDRLARVWGKATNEAWHDPEARVRASYTANTDDGTCWLRFEPVAELDAWFAALPLEVLGAAPDGLLATLGPAGIRGDGNIKWERAGVGFATAPTDLQATIDPDKGTIVELTATTQTDPATTAALVALLAKRAGAAPRSTTDNKTTKHHWDRSTPRFALFVTSDYLRAGTDFLTLFVD